ncbi:PepSY domain-containing protein [Streptomyces sp. NPDC051569]|uniref:PepSY domain-containing protein n=1 Tax=Streptomyces sp. NPDC051569 TaxID=3365661 RepID=UPI0037A61D32
MKRNLVIAAITAAALLGGGTYTAVAMGGDDHRSGTATTARPAPAGSGAVRGASEAAALALKKYPGTVISVERDDDGTDRTSSWEVKILGKDNRRREVRIDAATGAVRTGGRLSNSPTGTSSTSGTDNTPGHDARDDRAALRGATVDAGRAGAAAVASVPGTVTSVELDDDRGGRWEVEVDGKDGRTHEVDVHPKTGQVTPHHDDHPHGGADDGTRSDDKGRSDDHGEGTGHDRGDDHGGRR